MFAVDLPKGLVIYVRITVIWPVITHTHVRWTRCIGLGLSLQGFMNRWVVVFIMSFVIRLEEYACVFWICEAWWSIHRTLIWRFYRIHLIFRTDLCWYFRVHGVRVWMNVWGAV